MDHSELSLSLIQRSNHCQACGGVCVCTLRSYWSVFSAKGVCGLWFGSRRLEGSTCLAEALLFVCFQAYLSRLGATTGARSVTHSGGSRASSVSIVTCSTLWRLQSICYGCIIDWKTFAPEVHFVGVTSDKNFHIKYLSTCFLCFILKCKNRNVLIYEMRRLSLGHVQMHIPTRLFNESLRGS